MAAHSAWHPCSRGTARRRPLGRLAGLTTVLLLAAASPLGCAAGQVPPHAKGVPPIDRGLPPRASGMPPMAGDAPVHTGAAPSDGACRNLLTAFFTSDESLYYAVSTDGLAWQPLNGYRAVLNTTVPATSIRDPYAARGPDGTYRLVATNGHEFGGTTTILTWTSADLVTWSAEHVVDVMGEAFFPGAQITDVWAPEWRFDPVSGQYMVFWAARGDNLTAWLPGPCSAPGVNPQRFVFFASLTPDFVTFAQPAVLFDPGCNITDTGDGGIDGDIAIDEAGRPVMIYKDARGANETVRGIRIAASLSGLVTGPYSDASEGPLLATLVEAPEAVYFGDQWLLYYDCSFRPTPPGYPRPPYGVSVSPHLAPNNFTVVPGACSDTNPALAFPKGMTHGSFLCLTDDELAPVLAAFPPQG
jgi:hypothetical protein